MPAGKAPTAPDSLDNPSAHPRRPKAQNLTRDEWNQRYAKKDLIWSAKPNGSLVAEVAGLPPGHALDLAAGEGRNTVWLAEQGWTVHAVDFADQALEKGKALAEARGVADRVTFEAADLHAYAPEPGRFDLVIMMYFHIVVDDLPAILLRAARAVAPGGTLLLVAHDSDNLEHGYGGPQRLNTLYTAPFAAAAIGEELEIEKASRIERPVQTDDGVKTAIDCLVRARRA